MDRHTWMYKIPRATADYIKGVEDFITYAMLYLEKKHKEEGKEQMILCPCRDCNNFKKYRSVDTVRDHLFRRGFKEGYEKWIWHGEGLDSTRTSGTKRGREEDSMEKNDEEDMENDRVIDPIMLDTLQSDIIVTLCEFEIFLCTLKAYVRNRYRPEGSIIEGYSIEETIEFCTEYLATVDPIGIPKSRHEGRLEGHGTLGSKMISPSAELCDRAHLFVLQHMTEVDPYLKEHIALIRQMHPLKSGKWVTNEHNRSFGRWFKERVMSQLSQRPDVVSNTLKWLAYGPDMPRRILGIENVEDEDEYDQFDENPPFSMGVSTSYENEFVDADYIRNDHDEGVWIDGQVWAAGFAAALLKKRSSATYSSVEAGEDNAAESETNVAKLGPKEPLLVEVVLLLLLEKLFSFLLNTPDLNQYIFSMDGDKSDSNSSRGKKRKPRGPTLCTKLKEKIKNKKTESKIEFDEDGTAVGDMASQFASYIGTEVRLHVNINIKGWNLVNEGLKNMLWEDIKMHWKLEDDQLKKQKMIGKLLKRHTRLKSLRK
ncbi:hypothetical protein POM88_034164 [Heracleum sosnowskyi]|uniref:Transposase n=2 Tax=Heracleum sosnowskyi TaxID=360622 RepID=A0AAD8MCR0_9APIA|nr:hypothetical protein POM88_034164 [Heracleum sosnowskyi]